MKRVISFLLCMILLFGLGDWSVLAAEDAGAEETAPVTETEENQEETPDEEAADTPEPETSDEEAADMPEPETPDEEATDTPEPETSDEEAADTPEPETSDEETPDEETADISEEASEEAPEEASEEVPESTSVPQTTIGKITYLSDIPNDRIICTVGSGDYMRDTDIEGESISLLIDGTVTEFTKGVAAHADACLIYDLGEGHGYDKFKAYIGVDSDTGSNGDGVYFRFYGSADNETWMTICEPETLFKGDVNAEEVELSVKDYRYFRVDVDCNENIDYDHAVMAEACFVEEITTLDGDTEGETTSSDGMMRYLSSLEDSEILTKEIGWGSYGRDVNPDGGKISVMIDGTRTYFTMGVSAHATSVVVYDLGEDHIYDKFSGYFGVDASREGNGLASLELSGSMDNENWVSLYKTGEMRGNTNTVLTEVSLHKYDGETDLGRYRYLKLNTYEGANNAADHTVIADAKLYTEGYVKKEETQIQSFDFYDKQVADELAKNNGDYAAMIKTESGRKAVLQRELVTKFGSGSDGYDTLTLNFFSGPKEKEHRELIAWLMEDTDAAAELFAGGEPDGSVSYKQVMMVLSDLYAANKADLEDNTALYSAGQAGVDANRRRKDVYRTLMFSLALSCASGVYSWQHNTVAEDPLERYDQFKKIYTHGTNHVRYDIFENLNVEEMRWVTGSRIYNEELYWTNRYVRAKSTGDNLYYPALYSPHRFLHYGKDWWYGDYGFYEESNFASYTNTYMLAEDGEQLVANDGYPHLWMNMTPITSHICWGISYIGTCIAASFGVPSHYALQPGHAVFFVMQRDTSTGNITWGIDNNISGWLQTRTGETVGRGYTRMLCDWGTTGKRGAGEWPGPYLLLAQYALDHEDKYEQTTELLSLISTANDNATKEKIYRAVLDIMPYQYDAWYGLVQIYRSSKSTKQMADLAEEIAENLTYFPMPMHDLLALLRDSCKNDAENLARIVTAEDNALNEALLANSAESKAPSDMMQKDVCVAKAQQLKGSLPGKLATFSFDGDNAGSIVFGSSYEGVRFQYSLDGGKTWTGSGENTTSKDNMTKKLSDTELKSITAETDIYIWLEGWSSADSKPDKEKAFLIDISAGLTEAEVQKLLEVNDFEDRLLGNLTSLEYSIDGGENWVDLTENTDLSGDKTVKVRKRASGTTLQSTEATFTFTDNHNDDTRSYIRLSRLSVYDFSTEAVSQNQQAVKAIDGLESTIWHTQWGGGDSKRYITLKADKPTFFSGIDYLPRTDAGNGTITYCEVQVSVDGISWYTAATASWSRNNSVKSITFTDAAYGQYIRIVGKSAAGDFCSAREIRVFENKTFAGKTVAGARLTQEPTKLVYADGEVISFDGAEVQCVYTDGSTHKVPLSMLTVTPKYASGEGTTEVSLKYLNLPAMTFEIYVTPNTHTASGLKIDSPASKTSYTLGSVPDTTGLVLLATEESSGTTTTWKVAAGEYTVSPATFTEKGTQKVTLTYQGKTAEYEVTVIGKPESVSITTEPQKTTYEIGEALAVDDMIVTVTYDDETTEELKYDSGRLRINGDGFSALPGEKELTVTLTDDQSLTAKFSVTVLTNLIDGEFCYDVEPSTDNPPQYTCYLSGYTNTANTVVSVPASVTCNGITYQVIGVRSGTFATASQVEYLSLPGTIQTLEENSLSALTGLKQLYLTGISDIADLTIRDGALPEQSEEGAGTIYMASDTMETALAEKLEAYKTTGEGEFNMKQGDLATSGEVESITVTPPEKTVYELGETYDPAGFAVTAHLKNGIDLPLENALYKMDDISTSTYGQQTIRVKYGDDAINSFTMEVLRTAPTMLTNPQDGVYLPGDKSLSSLSVTVRNGDDMKLEYQWYKSETSDLSPEKDEKIQDATENSYTPSVTGYYYVAVWRLDDRGDRSNPVYSMAAHIQVQDFAIKVVDPANKETYFEALDEAVAKAASGSTIYLRKNIAVTRQTSVVGKTLTIAPVSGLEDTVTIGRDAGYTGCLIEANDCELTIKNVILDGGAVWTGDTDASLGRGTTNSGVGETASLLRMQNNTQLTLTGVTVQNCAVVSGGGAWGAALYVTSGADVTISGSTFKDNALGKGGCGAIQTDSGDSVITVSESTFTGNYAPVNGGAFCISAGRLDFESGTISHCKAGTSGGGIYVDSNGKATFGGTIDTCSAPSGGGIYTKNGITMTDGTVKNCSASGDGGGIYAYSGAVTVTGGKLEDCSANNGGGIYSVNKAVTVKDATFNNCTSVKSGGAIYSGNYSCNLTRVTFVKCSGYDGGVIYTYSGNVNVVCCTFAECSAGACGGCICTFSGTVDVSGETSINSCTAKLAGALWTNTGVIKVHDPVMIDRCKAVKNNNGGMGGAISTLSGRIEILGGTISDCSATDGGGAVRTDTGAILVSGGTIDRCKSTADGGALLTGSGTITISGGTIQGCTASSNGGAVCTNSGAVNITGGTIDGGNTNENSVTNAKLGGGIYSKSGAITMSGGNIQNCNVSYRGGGIYTDTGAVTFSDGNITGCVAADDGGAICISAGTVLMTGGMIDACKATKGGGGAICTVSEDNANGSVTVSGGTIQNCTAAYIGGGVYSSSAGIITVNGGTFRKNTAKYGGAVGTNSIATKNTYINGGTYSENSATANGGVIFIGGDSTVYINGGTYKGNTAANGGSIYCAWNGGTHNFSGGLFLYDGNWIHREKNNPKVTITGGTYSIQITKANGLDTDNYTLETTQLKTRGSDAITKAYTVVKTATETAEDHTELKNATILHTTNAQNSEDTIIKALKETAGDDKLTFDLTAENTKMTLEVTEYCTDVEVNSLGEITRYTFDVTPKVTVTYTTITEGDDNPVTENHTLSAEIPNDAIHEDISFTLPVDSGITAKSAMVYHEDTLLGILPIKTDTESGSKYIAVKSRSFSRFSYILLPETTCGDLAIKAANATLYDNITMNYRVLVPAGYEDSYMVFGIYSDVEKDYVESIVSESTPDTKDGVTYRVFSFEGINPQRMRDNIRATLYASKDGVWYKVEKNEYSLETYFTALLSNDENDAYFSLVSNLIEYGSAAQEYTNYETEQLISSAFEENKNYKAVDYSGGSFDDVQTLTREDNGITFKSASLHLDNEVSVVIRFTLTEGTSIDDVSILAGFDDQTEKSITEFADEGNGVYSFMFRNIPAACFSEPILFKAYANGQEDDILRYNVNSYLKSSYKQNSKLGHLTTAMFNYGYAAKLLAEKIN